MELLITKTLPFVLVTLSFLAISLSFAKSEQENGIPSPFSWQKSSADQSSATMEFDKNDLLVGLSDPFFWFLAPLFALLAVGVCVVLNYALMIILYTLTFIYSMFSRWPNWISNERRYNFFQQTYKQKTDFQNKRKSMSPAFSTSSPRRRIMTTFMLLFFVATLIPYQFAYMVACIVQIATCVRALKFARESVCFLLFDLFSTSTHTSL